jgi:hypothetical protein
MWSDFEFDAGEEVDEQRRGIISESRRKKPFSPSEANAPKNNIKQVKPSTRAQ